MEIVDKKIKGEFDGFTPFQLHIKDNKLNWVVGTYQHEQNRICISHAQCPGKFKTFAHYLVRKFKTNKILIYNIMNINNWKGLKGFKKVMIEDPCFKEETLCLEGLWGEKSESN